MTLLFLCRYGNLETLTVQSTLRIVLHLGWEAYILLLINEIKIQNLRQLSKNNCR